MPAGRRRARPQVRAQAQIAMSERMLDNHNGVTNCLHPFPESSELVSENGERVPMTYEPFARGRPTTNAASITLTQMMQEAEAFLGDFGTLPWVPAPHVQRSDATWSQEHKNKFIDSLFHGQASQTCFVIHKDRDEYDCQGEILDAGHRYRTIMEFVGLHPETPPFLWKPDPDASSKLRLTEEERRAVAFTDLPYNTRRDLLRTTFPVAYYYGLDVQEKANLFARMQIQMPLTNGEELWTMSAYKPMLKVIKRVFQREDVQELFTRYIKVNMNDGSTDLEQMKHYPYFTAIGYNFFLHTFGDVSVRERADAKSSRSKFYQFKHATGFCTQDGKEGMEQLSKSDTLKEFFEKQPSVAQTKRFENYVKSIVDVLEGAEKILPKQLFIVSLVLLHGWSVEDTKERFLELRQQDYNFDVWLEGLRKKNRRARANNAPGAGDDIWNSPATREYKRQNAEPHWDEKNFEFDRPTCSKKGLKLDKTNTWTRFNIFLNPTPPTLVQRRARQERASRNVRRRLDTGHVDVGRRASAAI